MNASPVIIPTRDRKVTVGLHLSISTDQALDRIVAETGESRSAIVGQLILAASANYQGVHQDAS